MEDGKNGKQTIPFERIISRLKKNESSEDRAALRAWLTEDKANKDVYVALVSLWNTLIKEGINYPSEVDKLWKRQASRICRKTTAETRLFGRRVRRMAAVAFILILLGLGYYVTTHWHQTGMITQTYSALNGKSKAVLPDGSVVWLQSGSEIEYSQSVWRKIRSVRLRGEAYFDVAKNTGCPFVVQCRGFEVKVYGTTFNINAPTESEDMEVCLLSGQVSVRSSAEERLIKPGERALCSKHTGHITVEEADVRYAAMWAKESVRIEKKSIRELAKLLSKWYNVTIVLDPEMPEDQAYTFTITNEPLEEILRLMTRINPVQYRFDENNVLTIKK